MKLTLALLLVFVLAAVSVSALPVGSRFRQLKSRVRAAPCDNLNSDIKVKKLLGGGVAGKAYLLETGSVAKIMPAGGSANTEKAGFTALANRAGAVPFFLKYGDAGVDLDGEAHVFVCSCDLVSEWEDFPSAWGGKQCQFEIMESFDMNMGACTSWSTEKKLAAFAMLSWASEKAFVEAKYVQNDAIPLNYGWKHDTTYGKICLSNADNSKTRCIDTGSVGGIGKLFDFDKSKVGAARQTISINSFKLGVWKHCSMPDTTAVTFDELFSSEVFDSLPDDMDGATKYVIAAE